MPSHHSKLWGAFPCVTLPRESSTDLNLSSSKFFGNPNDPEAKQQSTLAFGRSKESTKSKKEDADEEDLQPGKKRTISGTVKDEDTDGVAQMAGGPESTIVTDGESSVDSHESKADDPVAEGVKGMTQACLRRFHLPFGSYRD